MDREIVTEAPSVEEAVDAALEQLGVQQDAVKYEVLEEPGRKVFGLGSDKPAKVRVWVTEEYVREIQDGTEDEDEPEEAPSFVEDSDDEDVEVTDEELDKIADTAVDAIQTILGTMDLEASIEEYEGDDGEIILDVVGADLAVLIGRHGRTLESLQALVSAITNRKLGYRYPVVIDVEGYRHRRREKLETMARRTADRAARQHSSVRLRPMNAYERRVIHVALRSDTRVTTSSEGVEPNRQVVVKPR